MQTEYMHIMTGSIDTREGWIESYSADELSSRGLKSGKIAFIVDEGVTLIKI